MSAVEASSRQRWRALAVAFSTQVSIGLAGQAAGPLAPLFQPELGLSKAEVGLFTSAAFAGSWGALLLAGTLADRWGTRTAMSLGLVVAGTIMLAMVLVGGFLQALAVLFAVGLARALPSPGTTKTIMDFFPRSGRATAMGAAQAAAPVSGILAASLLPAIALAAGWRAALAAAGVWIILSGILAGIFYPGGRKVSAPRGVPMSAALSEVLRNRDLWILSLICILFVTAQLATIAHLALYLAESVLVPLVPDPGARVSLAGAYLAICLAGGVVARVLWGVLSDRAFHGLRLPVLALLGLIAALASLGMAGLGSGYPSWLLIPVLLAWGATVLGWNGLYHALVVETVGRKYAGTGVGLSLTLTQIGTVGGPPLFGFITDVTGSYPTAWLFLGLLCALGALAALLASKGEKLLH